LDQARGSALQFSFVSKKKGVPSMDGQKFDKLTRAFASGIDRRSLLKLFGGATVAGVAGMTVAKPLGVFAQGSVEPGGTCATDADCAEGKCDPTGLVCYCEDPSRPEIGCSCNAGVQNACGGRPDLCCVDPNGDPGGPGTCASPMVGCQTPVDDSCISGTEGACDAYNEENGTDYICCNWGGAEGSAGNCVAESACVVEPPNTGAGTTADASSWIAPAAAIGAAAAVMAYKSRESKADSEA
jgi:hypothetical protein